MISVFAVRRRVTLLIGLIVFGLASLSAAEGAAAQTHRWHQWRTAEGCLFYSREDPAQPYGGQTPKSYRWSGPCTPGQLIDGHGVMEMRHPLLEIDRFTGRLVQGYFHGRFTHEGNYNPSGVLRARTFDQVYEMGCLVHYIRPDGSTEAAPESWRGCIPGRASGSTPSRPATPAPPAPPAPAPRAAAPAPAAPLSPEMRALRRRAESGDATAQDDLGFIYDRGVDGVPMDHAEALRWYRRAAEQGHLPAIENMASMHRMGRGTPIDLAEAARWYRLAADRGSVGAQLQLAELYAAGQGVERNEAEAMRLYRLALEVHPDNRRARERLGELEARQADASPAPPRPERPLNDESRCISPDFSGEGMGGFRNSCAYPVYVSFCNLDAPERGFTNAFDCRTQRFGLEGVAGNSRKAVLILKSGVYWYACRQPSTPGDVAFELGRGVVAQCR